MGKLSATNLQQDKDGHTLLKVFVSYRRNDNVFNHMLDIVDMTLKALNESNDLLGSTNYRLQKFTDIVSIDYGDRWEDKVNEAIESADILLAFITPGYIESPICRHEYNHFVENAEDDKNEDGSPRRCIPIFWTSQKSVDEKLKNGADTATDKIDYENACKTWEAIKEFNGLEAILPKFIELLKDEAQGSDYDFVKDCIVRWLSNKVYIVANSIIQGKQQIDAEGGSAIVETPSKPLDDTLYAALSGLTLYLSTRSAKGTAHVSSQGFVVEKGTEISASLTASCPGGVIKQREAYSDLIQDCILTDDIVFSSPSSAAGFVAGRSSNGKTAWKTKDGRTINALLEEYGQKR